jgi:hypothetical protein
MRLTACFAALALLAAAPATARTAAPSPAQTASSPGLAIADVSAWIASKGGEVQPVQRSGDDVWLAVKDGDMTWLIFFYGCTADVCGDIQYAASFSNPTITQAMVNDWNRDRRFLKAAFVPGADDQEPSAIVQYDLLLGPGGVEQLNDPTAVWVGMVGEFATAVGYFRPEGEAPPAAPAPGH